MKVRIIRQPHHGVNGISLSAYRPGRAYEFTPSLANYFVAKGWAIFEMRAEQQPPWPKELERRKPQFT